MNVAAPSLEYAFEIVAEIDDGHRIGRSADEQLWFTPVTGGTVRGPLLNGTVLPGGGDWSIERSGTSELEARYLIQADDGTVIDIVNRGYYRAAPEVEARLDAGQEVAQDEYYFRSAPVFRTDAAQHRWLTEHQFVATLRAVGNTVVVFVFAVR